MIEIEDLSFTYNGAAEPALRRVSLHIEDGEFVLLTGPSGCGKSTLCRCLNGLVPHFYGGAMAGRVMIGEADTKKHATREPSTIVGMVFQDPENQLLTDDLEREIAFGLENIGLPPQLMRRRVEEGIHAVGLAALRRRPLRELSGGEKQRVALASVLAMHPRVLVLDEPTSQLDPQAAEDVLHTVKRLNDDLGITVVLVEHRMDRVIHLVDRVVVLDQGRLVADGPPRQVMAGTEVVRLGIGLPPLVQLVGQLRKAGLVDGAIPLTVKEGRAVLREELKRAGPAAVPATAPCYGDVRIEFERVWHTYDSGVTALRNVSLQVRSGEFVAIMGANGSGKTTLAKHLNALLKPTRGAVRVGGVDIRDATPAQMARHVGYLFQNPNDHLVADTVEEEVAFTLKNLGFSPEKAAPLVDGALAEFGLEAHRRRYPRSLSGGERQLVALASVVAARPQILVLDEPTRGLEHRLKVRLLGFLDRYRSQGNIVLLISHDVEMIAEGVDRVIMLSEGSVVADGDKRQVLSQALLFSPQINRLLQGFESYGLPQDVLTVAEAAALLL